VEKDDTTLLVSYFSTKNDNMQCTHSPFIVLDIINWYQNNRPSILAIYNCNQVLTLFWLVSLAVFRSLDI